MKKGLVKFIKHHLLKEKGYKVGIQSLDTILTVPSPGAVLIRAEPYSGATAIALEIAQAASERGIPVVIIDVKDSIVGTRLTGIDKNNLAIAKPSGVEEILNIVDHFNTESRTSPLYILDSVSLIRDKWNLTKNLPLLVERIKKMDPKCTVVCTAMGKGVLESSVWSIVINISFAKRRYKDGNLLGHILKLTREGSEETTNTYIEYKRGRVSRAYEYVMEQLKRGSLRTSEFTLHGISGKGMWNFIDAYTERVENDS